jgi:glycosyltransferase involved in cell wall biosynthesis
MKISVCIATYNGQDFIEEQIKSILNQLDQNDEIIISDDGSKDLTIDICKKFNDDRIKLIFNKNQHNNSLAINRATKNFENAITYSKGDLIFLCDQDDIWHQNKVQIVKDLFIESNCMCLVHDAILINTKGEKIANSYFEKLNSRPGLINNIFKNSFLGCCMAFRKEIKESILPFPKKLHAHDMWIGIISNIYFKVNYSNQKLTYYRRHSNSITNSGSKSDNTLFYRIHYRINFIYLLIIRIFKLKIK